MKLNKGMSLTEVVVATALVTVAVGGIIAVTVQGTTLGQSTDYAYVALNLAKNRIERLREIRKDIGYAALSEAAETDTVIDRNGNPDPNGDFVRTTVVDTTYAANLTKVTVRVRYKIKGTLIPTDIELVTLISPYA